jgi:hypothetical protein
MAARAGRGLDPGEDWNFDDAAEMRRRYPRLWALYDHNDTPSAAP